MNPIRIAAALALAATAPLAIPSIATAAAPEWGSTTARSPEGGHVLGNPEAEISLIKFVSYTCPHCANFEKQSDKPLRNDYVQPGKLSLEVRHLIRDPVDMTAVLLAECGPSEKFFANHRTIFSAHDQWMAKAQASTAEQRERWSTGPTGERFKAIAADLELYELMETRGYNRAELDRCLADEAAMRRFAEESQAGMDTYSVRGTPSFVMNGTLLTGVHSWAALQQVLTQQTK